MYELFDILGSYLEEFLFPCFIAFLLGSTVLGFFLLTKGGDLLSDYCSIFAERLGIPPVIIGLTIVSVATSAPELFTSIAAINSSAGALVLGNITGSNVANIGLILGISLLIKPISTHNAVAPVQLILLAIVTLGFSCAIAFNQNSELGMLTGFVLILFIISYLSGLCISSLKKRSQLPALIEDSDKEQSSLLIVTLMIFVGGILLWIGSESLVYGSKNLAEMVGVPNELIGFTLIAIGTSLPELAASISLLKKDETQMLLGNIIGSNIFNIGLVGGVAGILGPIESESPYPWIDHSSMIIFTSILIFWMRGKNLSSKNGLSLLALYFLASMTTWVANS